MYAGLGTLRDGHVELVGEIRPGIASRIADRDATTAEETSGREIDEANDRAAFDAGTD